MPQTIHEMQAAINDASRAALKPSLDAVRDALADIDTVRATLPAGMIANDAEQLTLIARRYCDSIDPPDASVAGG